jgi:hypothetical protein
VYYVLRYRENLWQANPGCFWLHSLAPTRLGRRLSASHQIKIGTYQRPQHASDKISEHTVSGPPSVIGDNTHSSGWRCGGALTACSLILSPACLGITRVSKVVLGNLETGSWVVPQAGVHCQCTYIPWHNAEYVGTSAVVGTCLPMYGNVSYRYWY